MSLNKIRIIFIILSLIFLSVFIYIKISPFGTWSCQSSFNRSNHLFLGRSCFSKPFPNERFILEKSLKMIGDPLYFSLYSPRNFDKLNLEIKFKANLEKKNPLIEAGLLVNRDLWHYQLKPIYNYWLEDYQSNWQRLNIEDDILNILENNCHDIPLNLCLAQYNINETLPNFILDRESSIIEQNLSLRGHHSFYVYLKDSDFKLKLKAKKINLNLEENYLSIDIYSNNSLIHSQSFTEEEFNNIFIYLASMPEGFYRVDLKANDNLVISNLSINSSILSFRHRLWLYSPLDRNINIVSDSRVLQVKVQEPAAYQTLVFKDKEFKLEELYKQYEIINDNNLEDYYYEIFLERGGLLLESPGVLAFENKYLYNPNYSHLNRFYQNQAKFVLFAYEKVEKLDDNYFLAKLEFDLSGVYREKGNYNLIISIPGLRVEDDNNNYLEIKNIKAKFSGKTLIDKINENKFFKK
jgi:hypothetical protein